MLDIKKSTFLKKLFWTPIYKIELVDFVLHKSKIVKTHDNIQSECGRYFFFFFI